MITVYLAKGERLELREAVAVRGEKFLGGDAGVSFLDAQGNVLAQFRSSKIAGYVDDVERTRRQVESHRERQTETQSGQSQEGQQGQADAEPQAQVTETQHQGQGGQTGQKEGGATKANGQASKSASKAAAKAAG